MQLGFWVEFEWRVLKGVLGRGHKKGTSGMRNRLVNEISRWNGPKDPSNRLVGMSAVGFRYRGRRRKLWLGWHVIDAYLGSRKPRSQFVPVQFIFTR